MCGWDYRSKAKPCPKLGWDFRSGAKPCRELGAHFRLGATNIFVLCASQTIFHLQLAKTASEKKHLHIFYHPFVNFKSNPIFAPVMVKLFHSETVCKGIRCNTWTVPAAVILFRTVRKAL